MKDNIIYLDNCATTQPYEEVLQTFCAVNERYYANPASIHEMGVEANELLCRARQQLAQLLRTSEKEIIFTSGGTESNNLAIIGTAMANRHRGQHIITTAIEHPSVLEAVKYLEKEGFMIDYLAVDDSGVISLDELSRLIRNDTVLVSIMHVNNEIGTIQPIQKAAEIIHHQSRAIFHVDAVQSFGKLPILFDGNRGPDLISISAHKIHGLKGTGLLAMRKQMAIEPLVLGGKQEFGLRSGTVAVPQIVAMAKAARLAVTFQQQQMEKYKKWKQQLCKALQPYEHSILFLSNEHSVPYIVSFSVRSLKGEVVVNALQQRGVIVSTSSACSSKQTKISHVVEAVAIEDMYKKGVIRISFGAKVTDEQIQQVIHHLMEVMNDLTGGK